MDKITMASVCLSLCMVRGCLNANLKSFKFQEITFRADKKLNIWRWSGMVEGWIGLVR